ncbi:prepilin peptidase [Clostridium sp. SHJSY1]|nr:prepilin peptidase [Clostridium sp. SHJSY1]
MNVCIFRIPKEESISFPSSHCRHCGYSLKFYDLIPVLSYIFLRGKCRNCKEKISIQYPLLEIINTTFYIMLYMKLGLTIDFFKYSTLISILLVIGMIDFNTKYVYERTIIFGLVMGIFFGGICWIKNGEYLQNHILGAIIGFLIIYMIERITGKMGGGDKEISAICGLFLGAKLIVFAVFSAIMIGGIITIIFLIFKLRDGKDEIAFGPYLALGSIFAIFLGDKLIIYYLSLY